MKIFLIIYLIVFPLSFALAQENTASGYSIADEVEPFSLKNVDGKMISLSDFPEAKGFILIFTCNHCPFSVAYEDRIIALDKQFKSQGYPVIALNPNDPRIQPEDSYDNMKKRAKNKKFTFPYLLDENAEVARKYGATKTPHVYVLHIYKGQPMVAYIGAIDDNSRNAADVKEKYVENAVNALLSGEAVNPAQTKAIGCSIKFPKP